MTRPPISATKHQLQPGHPVTLADFPTIGSINPKNRKQTEHEFKKLRRELIDLQYRFYADGRYKLLIIFQAMDSGGKDGTIRNVFRGVNPQGVRVTSFKQPGSEELAHDFLWRIHKAVPKQGMIGVFNRSHYEDVLIARVDRLVPESIWRPRYEQINQFEKLLAETGTTILKFFLHISKEEQKTRFQKRLDNPNKRWKFSVADLDKRKQWEDYMQAYQEMLTHCTTDSSPWHIIPADQKWYRNLAITRVIVDAIARLAPEFPQPEADLNHIEVN